MRNLWMTSAMMSLFLSGACGRLGTGDDMFDGDGDGDASIGDGDKSGDGDTFGDGDGDLGGAGDGDLGDGDGDLGDGDLGDGDASGGMGGTVGDGDGDIEPPDPNLPTCTIVGPADGKRIAFHGERVGFSGEEPAQGQFSGITFKATASDPQDGVLSGESIAWFIEGSGTSGGDELLGFGNELTVESLPPGENKIACHAFDSDENQGIDYVTVTSLSPVVYINHPGELDGPRPSNVPIDFVAVGYDYEDGTLNSEVFIWSSSLDGEIGVGNGAYELEPGEHVVKVTAFDEDDNEAFATVPVWTAEVVITEPTN